MKIDAIRQIPSLASQHVACIPLQFPAGTVDQLLTIWRLTDGGSSQGVITLKRLAHGEKPVGLLLALYRVYQPLERLFNVVIKRLQV